MQPVLGKMHNWSLPSAISKLSSKQSKYRRHIQHTLCIGWWCTRLHQTSWCGHPVGASAPYSQRELSQGVMEVMSSVYVPEGQVWGMCGWGVEKVPFPVDPGYRTALGYIYQPRPEEAFPLRLLILPMKRLAAFDLNLLAFLIMLP